MEIIYKANDGKEFSSKEECEAYENAQNALFSIKFYCTCDERYAHTQSAFNEAKGFNAINYHLMEYSSLNGFSDCYQSCSIIYIPSVQALEVFKEWKNSCAKQDRGELMVGFNFWYYDPHLENSHWLSAHSYLQWLDNEALKVRSWIRDMKLKDWIHEKKERPQEYSTPLIDVTTS